MRQDPHNAKWDFLRRHVGIKDVKRHVAFTNYNSLTVDII